MVKYYKTDLSKVFGAISDPTRRSIVAELGRGERTVTELAEPFRMSLPAVMKHLGALQNSGLVVRRKEGRTVYCRLDPRPLREANEWVSHHEKFWNAQLDNLGRYLTKDNKNKKHGK